MELLITNLKQLNRPRDPDNTPLYARLQRLLHEAIEAGSLEPGHALPSERELARLASLSRVTVRKAITALVAKGLLTQRHGAGTFVSERIVKSFSKLTSFTEDLRARGLKPRSRFLERAVGEVTPEEALALGLSPGARVVRLHRLRFAGDEPLALERTTVPQAILSDPAAVKSSLYEALDRVGCRPSRALQRLRAVNVDAEQSRLLSIAKGAAGLMIERRAFLADGRAVEYTRSLYRGDAYDFVAELHGE